MASRRLRRVGLLTGGGDCPGLNAVIRAAARTGFHLGWDVWGVEDGFDGLLTRDVRRLTGRDVRGILQFGGTILGTTNRRNPFHYPVRKGKAVVEADRSPQVLRNFKALGLDALIAIGGDGTLAIAERFARKGMKIVGVPKTIDNDIPATVVTFGFDTAVNTATDALDKLHTTAEAHKRVEVGREPRLGGIGEWLAVEIAAHTGKETRNLVLGHLQRGGQPTSFDRLLGTRFGAAAMRLVAEGRFGTMVALDPPRVLAVPLAKAVGHGRIKKVPLDSDILLSARDMGIGFGD